MGRVLLAFGILAAGCSDSNPDIDSGAAQVPNDSGTSTDGGDMLDATDGGSSGPLVELYDPAAIDVIDPSEIIIVSDDVRSVGAGRFIREVVYGIEDGGFPTSTTRFGIAGRLFFECDSTGTPAYAMTDVAVSLRAERSDAADALGKTETCAIETGHPCVVAANHLLNPGRFEPRYANEAGGGPISDSTILQFNIIDEYRRGTTASGDAIGEAPLQRLYLRHIAMAGMRLLSLTEDVILQLDLAEPGVFRFVVAGHSKWGGAAANIIAFDERVIGGVAAGWPLDWMRWLNLAVERWVIPLGIDTVMDICTTGERCLWRDTQQFRDFFLSTPSAPSSCAESPCPGTGSAWLRHFDVRSLAAAGRFTGKAFAAIRNGNEAHPVDLEEQLFATREHPDGFLFLPDVAHTFSTQRHSSFWRHWIRHSFDGAPTLDLSTPQLIRDGDRIRVTTVLNGATPIEPTAYYRTSVDGNFGGVDAYPAYPQRCLERNECSAWRMARMTRNGDEWSVVLPDAAGPTAVVILADFDDGSSDFAVASSPVVRLP